MASSAAIVALLCEYFLVFSFFRINYLPTWDLYPRSDPANDWSLNFWLMTYRLRGENQTKEIWFSFRQRRSKSQLKFSIVSRSISWNAVAKLPINIGVFRHFPLMWRAVALIEHRHVGQLEIENVNLAVAVKNISFYNRSKSSLSSINSRENKVNQMFAEREKLARVCWVCN